MWAVRPLAATLLLGGLSPPLPADGPKTANIIFPRSQLDHPLPQTWLDHLHRKGESDHTLQAYRRAVQHFARWIEASDGTSFDPAQVVGRDVRD